MTGGSMMGKNKAKILKECFAILDAEYGDKLTDQTRIFKKELFKKIIGGYPAEKIQEMSIKIIRTRKYNSFPKIAEMIEIIEGDKEKEAELAWLYLLRKMDEEGYYQSVRFPKYPAVAGVVEAFGGWPKLYEDMTAKEEKWIKKEFIKVYPIIKEGGNYPKYLPGFFELSNIAKGYDNKKMIEHLGITIDGRKAKRKKLIAQKGVISMRKP